jgi:hypothetical protein
MPTADLVQATLGLGGDGPTAGVVVVGVGAARCEKEKGRFGASLTERGQFGAS